MKYIITLFWGFILGHVAYYLGSQLTTSVYSFIPASLLGLFIALTVFILAPLLSKPSNRNDKVM